MNSRSVPEEPKTDPQEVVSEVPPVSPDDLREMARASEERAAERRARAWFEQVRADHSTETVQKAHALAAAALRREARALEDIGIVAAAEADGPGRAPSRVELAILAGDLRRGLLRGWTNGEGVDRAGHMAAVDLLVAIEEALSSRVWTTVLAAHKSVPSRLIDREGMLKELKRRATREIVRTRLPVPLDFVSEAVGEFCVVVRSCRDAHANKVRIRAAFAGLNTRDIKLLSTAWDNLTIRAADARRAKGGEAEELWKEIHHDFEVYVRRVLYVAIRVVVTDSRAKLLGVKKLAALFDGAGKGGGRKRSDRKTGGADVCEATLAEVREVLGEAREFSAGFSSLTTQDSLRNP